MKITLYSLPNCAICKMIKKKLEEKNIKYTEKDFSEIANIIKSDHAPALEIYDEFNETTIMTSPTRMAQWINS